MHVKPILFLWFIDAQTIYFFAMPRARLPKLSIFAIVFGSGQISSTLFLMTPKFV